MSTITVSAEVDLDDIDTKDLLRALRSHRVITHEEWQQLEARLSKPYHEREKGIEAINFSEVAKCNMTLARDYAARGNRAETLTYLARALGAPFDRVLT